MRIFPRQRVDPVLVSRQSAAELLSVDLATVDRLIESGDLPIIKQVGNDTLIAYRSLLIYAGIAKWYFREVIDV
jgi:phage terminase Nu1 subunit (DNA packaging protein)